MTEGNQTILAFTSQVLGRMRTHCFTGWPWALLWTGCLAGAMYTAGSGVPPSLPMALSVAGFVALIIWETAVLRQLTGADYAAATTELRYAISFFLYLVILLLGFVLILFPVILSTMALWALVSFEFEGPEPTQEELAASFEAFQGHPLFAVCVAIFVFGLAGVFALMMRGRAYAAASVSERRVVAMEAFQWTRGRTLTLLGTGVLVLLPFLMMIIGAGAIKQGLQDGGAALIGGCILLALTAWPMMLALQVLSVEIYQRYSADAHNSPQPEAL